MNRLQPFTRRVRIAYFSMEIAVRPEIHTYSGGLGILAGDVARACADLNLPVVLVTLLSREGYFRQEIDAEGHQVEHPDPWDPASFMVPLGAMVAVEIERRMVWIRPWLYLLTSPLGHAVPVLFLDTDLSENAAADRTITHNLYGGDQAYRLAQEMVLGIGGVRILRALGFEIGTYHMNEGHSALLALELLTQDRQRSSADLTGVRRHCVFTTHTPVDAAHERFTYELVQRLFGDLIDLDLLRRICPGEQLNMTRLALGLSGYINGVAERHSEITERLFPGYDVRSIANGVHVPSWAHPEFARLFQANFPHWGFEPEVLVRADQLPDADVWAAHQTAKGELLAEIKARGGPAMDLERPLIGFARRITAYKRPELLFTDIDRLVAINREFPFQVVMAGKAHPRDFDGKQRIFELHAHIRRLAPEIPIAFLANYDMAMARSLVSGTDLWLNTPQPPFEASGTSGMKAAINGVLSLSTLDGWWLEARSEGVVGWSIGEDPVGPGIDDAAALYDKMQRVILPLYARERPRWIWMMKQAMSKIPQYFNSQRMMRRYATEAYLRSGM
ncbi:MAG: alpha-glucan family phosphorylase [Stellaceae bacterium]